MRRSLAACPLDPLGCISTATQKRPESLSPPWCSTVPHRCPVAPDKLWKRTWGRWAAGGSALTLP